MKVLEKKDWGAWRVTVKCAKCESALEAESTDIHAQFYDADGPTRPSCWSYLVKCPVCRNEVYLNSDLIPPYLQEQAQAASRRKE